MSKIINIRGEIIPNDLADVYDWFGFEYTNPKLVEDSLADAIDRGEDVIVRINSVGGDVYAGVEIYSLLHDMDVVVEIIGIAASAASMIAMSGKIVKMHPSSQIMVHNASGIFSGDYHEMQHGAKVLQDINKSIAMAFVAKSKKPIEDVLALMDKESFIPADKALEYGFADEIVGMDDANITNAYNGLSVTPEMIIQARTEKAIMDKELAERAKEKAKLELALALY